MAPTQKKSPTPLGGLSMKQLVVEAIKTSEDKKGMSVVAMKKYICQNYPHVGSRATFSSTLKRCILKALENEELKRGRSSQNAVGISGRFKLVATAKAKKPRDRSTSPKEAKLKGKATKPRDRSGSPRRPKTKKPTAEGNKSTKTAKTKSRSRSTTPSGKTKAKKAGEKAQTASPVRKVKKTKSKSPARSKSPAADRKSPAAKRKSSKSPAKRKPPAAKSESSAAKRKSPTRAKAGAKKAATTKTAGGAKKKASTAKKALKA